MMIFEKQPYLGIRCLVFLLLFVHFSRGNIKKGPKYKWREEIFPHVPIDHFSFEYINGTEEPGTFSMRYLINDEFWDPKTGVIFFYPGNEGWIEHFAEHTGLMWDWAPEFKALLVFAEHRYYGLSLPYGNRSSELPYLGKLTVEQAMADYALLLQWLKRNVSVSSDVIAFGGSYGGMLAAWMRMKYPSLVAGAIASSAPIEQLPGGSAPCWSFTAIATRTFAASAPKCAEVVKRSWSAFLNKSKTEKGRQWLNTNFRLCNGSFVGEDISTGNLMASVVDSYIYAAMFDYPYPTNFLRPLPAWPVKVECSHLTDPTSFTGDDDALLLNVFKAMSVYRNHTGQEPCFSLQAEPDAETKAVLYLWGFQTCTELFWLFCNKGTDMFRTLKYNQTLHEASCRGVYHTKPRPDWLTLNYGAKQMVAAKTTRIIFVNCELDPWAGSGIQQESLVDADPSLVVINIANAAHHYDLRASHPNDTVEVIQARNRMKNIVRNWLSSESKPAAANASDFSKIVSYLYGL